MIRRARWLAVGALVALVGCHHATGSRPADVTAGATPKPAPAPTQAPKEVTMPSGLMYQDLVVGSGQVAEPGMDVSVHYTGRLTDGTSFDSNLDPRQPLTFRLGAGQVIRGWDEGVAGMRVGGKRKLTIPSDLGYGAAGAYDGPREVIPPNATLMFDVELVGVR